MRAEELRIGNLLKGGEVVIVHPVMIMFKGVANKEYGLSNPKCRALKLNEEWLSRCGFIYYTNKESLITNNGYWKHKEAPVVWRNNRLTIDNRLTRENVKYVHTLQNVFYYWFELELKVN